MSAYIKTKSGKIVKQNSDLASRHLGIIAQRSIFWHRFLPIDVRNYYDVEDMIGEVALHVIKRAYHHSSERGKESTFVWHTADNKCKSILMHYKTKMYSSCETVELTPDVSQIFSEQENEQYRLSLDAVERVIELGSDRLLDLIDQILFGHVNQRCITDDVITEFRRVARYRSVTLDDFLRVYHYVHC